MELAHNYYGTSAEIKPKNAPYGSHFFETDTEELYIKYDTTWRQVHKQATLIETLTADRVIVSADNGKTFFLDAVGEAISLPALEAGLNFKFRLIADTITTDWTIVAATDVIEGYADVNYATVIALNENTISFVAAAAIIGDEISLLCDGTSWHVSGKASATGAVTFTAP